MLLCRVLLLPAPRACATPVHDIKGHPDMARLLKGHNVGDETGNAAGSGTAPDDGGGGDAAVCNAADVDSGVV